MTPSSVFQYPLFRIELLSSVVYMTGGTTVVGFNIRSFGSNCSAITHLSVQMAVLAFQYPLFRIELLSDDARNSKIDNLLFQYPLFRIELLS